MTGLPRLEEVQVQPCVTQVYPSEGGTWWRYCLTCDDGSNKYQRHKRGHRTEADAQMSARDHAKASMANRRWLAWSALWRDAILAAQTWDEFSRLYQMREHHLVKRYGWPRIDWENFPDENREKTMRMVKENYRAVKEEEDGAQPLA